MEVGHLNVVQIVTDDAHVECCWITQIVDDAMYVRNFILDHSMRLSMFNSFNTLKLLALAPTRFASTIVMLKRFKHLKKGLQEMVISEQWSSYKADDINKAKFVKETLLDDIWWDKKQVNVEFANFSGEREDFDDIDPLRVRGLIEAKSWWLVHGAHAPTLQKIALTNKMTSHRAEDLVFVYSNLRLLSKNSPQYHQEETKMWEIAGDEFGSLDKNEILEVANLSLDELELEIIFFNDDDQEGRGRT
ncbi:hypothetical protein GmHk_13G037891 [Glycine max]|nr:hypothetical protein GmHk_13G037891 [Glycine max]